MRKLRSIISAPSSVVLWSLLVVVPLVWLYVPVLKWWIVFCVDPENSYQHALLVPLISGYLLWKDRDLLHSRVFVGSAGENGRHSVNSARLTTNKASGGAWLIAIGLLIYLLGLFVQVNFIQSFSMVVVATGLCWRAFGFSFIRKCWFPFIFLVFAVPLSPLFEASLLQRLQTIAARSSAAIFGLLGIPVHREGVALTLPHFSFVVAHECSGMRSLIAVLTLTALISYYMVGPTLGRLALVFLSPLVALIGNVMRILFTGLCGYLFGQLTGMAALHYGSGLVLFGIAVACILSMASLFGLQLTAGDSSRQSKQKPQQAPAPAAVHGTVMGARSVAADGMYATAMNRQMRRLLPLGVALWSTVALGGAISPSNEPLAVSVLRQMPVTVGPWRSAAQDKRDKGYSSFDGGYLLMRDYVTGSNKLRVIVVASRSWRAYKRYLECAVAAGQDQLLAKSIFTPDRWDSGIDDIGVAWFRDQKRNIIFKNTAYLTRGHGCESLRKAATRNSIERLSGNPLFMQVSVFAICRDPEDQRRAEQVVSFTEELCNKLLMTWDVR